MKSNGYSFGSLEFKPLSSKETSKSIAPIKIEEPNSNKIYTKEFDIYSLILETLKPIGVPVFFAARKEERLPLILYNVTGERGVEYLDDKETMIRYKVSINIFSRGNYLPIKNEVLKRMKVAGFRRTDVPSCIYEESVDVYNQPIFFDYYKILD